MTEEKKETKVDLSPMNFSPTISAIAKALNAMQRDLKNVERKSKNPFHKSMYADLAAIWDTIRKPLADNGLAITQLIVPHYGEAIVDTYLLHTSGEWIKSRIRLSAKDPSPQPMGAAITYARRYALSAIVGIASEDDDDGNENMPAKGKPAVEMPRAKEEKVEPKVEQPRELSILKALIEPINGKPFSVKGRINDFSESHRTNAQGVVVALTTYTVSDGKAAMEIIVPGKVSEEMKKGGAIFKGVVQFILGEKKEFFARAVEFFDEEKLNAKA